MGEHFIFLEPQKGHWGQLNGRKTISFILKNLF